MLLWGVSVFIRITAHLPTSLRERQISQSQQINTEVTFCVSTSRQVRLVVRVRNFACRLASQTGALHNVYIPDTARNYPSPNEQRDKSSKSVFSPAYLSAVLSCKCVQPRLPVCCAAVQVCSAPPTCLLCCRASVFSPAYLSAVLPCRGEDARLSGPLLRTACAGPT